MVFKKKYISLFLVILLFSACDMYKDIEVGEIKGVKLEKLSGEGAFVKVLIPIKNHNSYSVKVKSYNLDIMLNDYKLTNVSSNENITIKGKSERIYEIPVKIKLDGVFSSSAVALFQLFRDKKLTVKIQGTATAGAFFISRKVKIDRTQTVELFK